MVITPRRMKASVMLLMKLLVTLFTAGVFLVALIYAYPETDFHFNGYIVFLFLYVVMFLAFVATYKAFRFGISRFREIMFSYLLSIVLTNFFTYFVLSLTAKQMLNVWALFGVTAIQTAGAFFLNRLADRVYFAVHPARDAILILSASGREKGILEGFREIEDRYRVLETVSESIGEETILERIRPYSTVIAGRIDRGLRDRLTEACFASSKRLFCMAEVSDIIAHAAKETFIGDSLLYLCKNRAFTSEQLMLKRAGDVVISALGLLIMSPFMLIVALLIKAWDGGPVLFTQTRYTRNLVPFTMYKFRSMIPEAEKDGARFTVSDDERITPIGRIIRATRFDELPQLYNILKGDMSLVGPRAERIENVDLYCSLMPEFRYRMKVKAGLTGYAQIYGTYSTSYEDKLKMDLLYIENCSILKDLQLLFSTIKVIFMPESTKGFAVSDPNALKAQAAGGEEPDTAPAEKERV